MPNFDTHFKYGKIFSVITGISTLIISANPLIALISASNTLINSLYPDTDIKSTSQRIVVATLLINCIVAFFILGISQAFILNLVISFILLLIPLLSKHRGMAHNTFFGLIVQCLVILIINHYFHLILPQILLIMLSGFIGFLVHIILDKCYKH